MRTELKHAMMRAAMRGKAILRKRGPVDQGQLKNSWMVDRNAEGNVNLTSTAPHAGVIEEGARPHAVSAAGYEAIYNWVRRNRHFFPEFVTAKGNTRPVRNVQRWRDDNLVADEDPRIARIARAIIHKLKKEGFKGTFFVRDSLAELRLELGDQTNIGVKKLAIKKLGGEG